MHEIAAWLEATWLSQAINRAIWLIELLQTVHILSVAIVFSSVLMLALRYADAGWLRDEPPAQGARRFMPWVWWGIASLAASGTLLIVGEPERTLDGNPAFEVKMALVAVGLVAASAFQCSRRLGMPHSRRTARTIAVASVVLCSLIVVVGRWIAYSQMD